MDKKVVIVMFVLSTIQWCVCVYVFTAGVPSCVLGGKEDIPAFPLKIIWEV